MSINKKIKELTRYLPMISATCSAVIFLEDMRMGVWYTVDAVVNMVNVIHWMVVRIITSPVGVGNCVWYDLRQFHTI